MNEAPSRRIWLCADDYGISPGVNRGIRELIKGFVMLKNSTYGNI